MNFHKPTMYSNAALDGLKEKLKEPLPGKDAQFLMAPTYRPSMPDMEPKQKAGVMLLLYWKENQLYFPLIKRPEYNGAHSGQISFPGGKFDPQDESITATALRECEEEIGVKATNIEVLGSLTKLYIPVSKFEVYPTVGFLNTPQEFTLQIKEVVSIIETPISMILSTTYLESKTIVYKEKEESIPFFNIEGNMVWGATAMILSEFAEVYKRTQVN